MFFAIPNRRSGRHRRTPLESGLKPGLCVPVALAGPAPLPSINAYLAFALRPGRRGILLRVPARHRGGTLQSAPIRSPCAKPAPTAYPPWNAAMCDGLSRQGTCLPHVGGFEVASRLDSGSTGSIATSRSGTSSHCHPPRRAWPSFQDFPPPAQTTLPRLDRAISP